MNRRLIVLLKPKGALRRKLNVYKSSVVMLQEARQAERDNIREIWATYGPEYLLADLANQESLSREAGDESQLGRHTKKVGASEATLRMSSGVRPPAIPECHLAGQAGRQASAGFSLTEHRKARDVTPGPSAGWLLQPLPLSGAGVAGSSWAPNPAKSLTLAFLGRFPALLGAAVILAACRPSTRSTMPSNTRSIFRSAMRLPLPD